MGKGSTPRPFSVPKDQFDSQYESIFGKYVPPYLRNRVPPEKPDQVSESNNSQKDKS